MKNKIKDKCLKLYLTDKDYIKLDNLSKKRKESKSALVRKLINIEKYHQTLKEIEKNNFLTQEVLLNLSKCGNNLNQIAYYLNAGIATPESEELKRIIEELKYVLQENQIKTKNHLINIDVKRIKTIKNENNHNQENNYV